MLKKKYLLYIVVLLSTLLLAFLSFTSIQEFKKKSSSEKAMQNAFSMDVSSPFSVLWHFFLKNNLWKSWNQG